MEKLYTILGGCINGIPLSGDGKFHESKGPKTFLKQYLPEHSFYEISRSQVYGYPRINVDWVHITSTKRENGYFCTGTEKEYFYRVE